MVPEAEIPDLFDHLIRPEQERFRDGQAEGLGDLEIDAVGGAPGEPRFRLVRANPRDCEGGVTGTCSDLGPEADDRFSIAQNPQAPDSAVSLSNGGRFTYHRPETT